MSSDARLFMAAVNTAAGITTPAKVPSVEYRRDATDRIVSRTATGEPEVRYGHTGGSDSPQVTLDDNNVVTQVSLGLPGGAVIHVTPGWDPKWSYPNLQGSTAAQADGTGAKTGGTFVYDPDGVPTAGGLPDTRPGDFDDTWMGGHQRPLEHATGLQPVIEMGARQYHPVLGRFLEIDPIEAGTNNDYGYVTDPINQTDLNGMCGLGNPFKACGPDHEGPTNIFSGGLDWTRRNSGAIASGLMSASLAGGCVAAATVSGGTLLFVCVGMAMSTGTAFGFGVGIAFSTAEERRQPGFLRGQLIGAISGSVCGPISAFGKGKPSLKETGVSRLLRSGCKTAGQKIIK